MRSAVGRSIQRTKTKVETGNPTHSSLLAVPNSCPRFSITGLPSHRQASRHARLALIQRKAGSRPVAVHRRVCFSLCARASRYESFTKLALYLIQLNQPLSLLLDRGPVRRPVSSQLSGQRFSEADMRVVRCPRSASLTPIGWQILTSRDERNPVIGVCFAGINSASEPYLSVLCSWVGGRG